MLGCKYSSVNGLNGKMCELIDTCWDVNVLVLVAEFAGVAGINRYMLGCKSDIVQTREA